MAYGCLGMRLTLVMCLMFDIKLTLYQNFIYSYKGENSLQSYIIQHIINDQKTESGNDCRCSHIEDKQNLHYIAYIHLIFAGS